MVLRKGVSNISGSILGRVSGVEQLLPAVGVGAAAEM